MRWDSIGLLMALAASLAIGTLPARAEPGAKIDYADEKNWLCRPGRNDACSADLATTQVAADGKLTPERFQPDPNAPIDCFYVYPTVSADPTGNSDMNPGPEERSVAASQFARFAARCRLYAPLYRQLTLRSLRSRLRGQPIASDPALAYGDVVDAWNSYLARDNKGRGVVLVGHSQGARMLTELMQNVIDGKPAQARIVSALLLGSPVAVPKNADVGGTFKHIPLCRAQRQTGCVVTFASFRATAPPPATSRFAHAPDGMIAGCTNPAALAGGRGELHAYLRSSARDFSAAAQPKPWVANGASLSTPFASVPGLLSAECVHDEHGSYLAVTVHGNPADARVDDIVGDVVVEGQVQADWGLHLIDVNLTLGNLLDVIGQQTKAFLAGARPKR
jgi:hypothetical protein